MKTPAECWHPSVFIKEEMDARGWTLDDLAMRMAENDPKAFGIERLGFDFYFEVGPEEPGLRLGDDAARLIAAAFGDLDAEYFLNLEKSWLAWTETLTGRAALTATRAVAKGEQ